MEPKESHVQRALQLDAKNLDDEFCSILMSKLQNSMSYFENKHLHQIEPELQALLKIFLYNFSLRINRQTVGQRLLDIKYSSNVSKRRLHCYSLLVIFLSWLNTRQSLFVNLIASRDVYKDRLWKIIKYIEVYIQALELVNIFAFLMEGRYSSILERVFQLKIVPQTMEKRTISYSYFARELLWNGFSDLLSFILPLISYNRFHNFIKLLLPSHGKSNSKTETEVSLQELDLHCVSCKDLAILPQYFGCKHVVCYYCVMSSLSSNGSFECLICGHQISDSNAAIPFAKKYASID